MISEQAWPEFSMTMVPDYARNTIRSATSEEIEAERQANMRRIARDKGSSVPGIVEDPEP
jgi:hypothetical protein